MSKPGPKPNPNRQTRSYSIWRNMKARCSNPNNTHWDYYGGKGIKVCDRWQSFNNFFEDMGESPDETTIERIDGNRDYEPSNCKWATHTEQMRNVSRNVNLTHNGVTQCLAEWARHINVSFTTLRNRIQRGWSVEKAVTTPADKRFLHK